MRNASISLEMIAVSVIVLVVIVVSITIYVNLTSKSQDEIKNMTEPGQCPEDHLCTYHQCMDIVGSSLIIGNIETPVGMVCCEQPCVCPKGGRINIRGVEYSCTQKSICDKGEKRLDLKSDDSMNCCCYTV